MTSIYGASIKEFKANEVDLLIPYTNQEKIVWVVSAHYSHNFVTCFISVFDIASEEMSDRSHENSFSAPHGWHHAIGEKGGSQLSK